MVPLISLLSPYCTQIVVQGNQMVATAAEHTAPPSWVVDILAPINYITLDQLGTGQPPNPSYQLGTRMHSTLDCVHAEVSRVLRHSGCPSLWKGQHFPSQPWHPTEVAAVLQPSVGSQVRITQTFSGHYLSLRQVPQTFLPETCWLVRVLQTHQATRQSLSRQRMPAKSLSPIRLFATPWTAACQAPLSMQFSRQE